MAKRAPEEEREFNPIQATLIQAAVGPAPTSSQAARPKNPWPGWIKTWQRLQKSQQLRQ